MAERSGFFDAHIVNGEYDRTYLAESFAKYFASFIGNGIFGGKSSELLVQQKSSADMSVKVLSGQAWINGYWYENDNDEHSLSIDISDGVLDRIDLVVVRWSNYDRVIRLAVKKGTPSTSASAPLLQRDSDVYELKLAQIYIEAGTTAITQNDITDTRLLSSVCGVVQGVVQQFDTEYFGTQINSFIEEFKLSNIAKAEQLFAELEGMISEEMAASLLLEVNKLKKINVEDEIESGCYYRINESNGEKEWINPPKKPGIEYCTTEKWNGKPIYQKMIAVGALPASSRILINSNTSFDKIISAEGITFNSGYSKYHTFPVMIESQVEPIAFFIIELTGEIKFEVRGDYNLSDTYITIKYTKPVE